MKKFFPLLIIIPVFFFSNFSYAQQIETLKVFQCKIISTGKIVEAWVNESKKVNDTVFIFITEDIGSFQPESWIEEANILEEKKIIKTYQIGCYDNKIYTKEVWIRKAKIIAEKKYIIKY